MLRATLAAAVFVVWAVAAQAQCVQSGSYPYSTNSCLNAPDINAIANLSIGPSPPQNGYGQGAEQGKPWIDTSQSPAMLRICAAPIGCNPTFSPLDWMTLGSIDFINKVTSWPIGGGVATLASGTLTDLSSTSASYVTITGNGTIQFFGVVQPGQIKLLSFSGNATLIESSSLMLPGGINFTTGVGATALAVSMGGGIWQLIPTNAGTAILNPHQPVGLATTAALPSNTYSNGAFGVGATLTATANGALSVDGTAVSASERILVDQEVTAANNGLYVVTATGGSGAPYVLTRAADFNSNLNVTTNSSVLVSGGATQTGAVYLMTSPGPITVGVTPLTFVEFTGAQIYTAGAGLQLSSQQFSIPNGGVSSAMLASNVIPQVANTTALRLACTGLGTCVSSGPVFAGGVTRVTDGVAGAPPLYFSPGAGSCMTDDAGSCINSADGNHWNGQFPASGADAREWGVKADGTTDNTSMLQYALNWAASNGAILFLPPGTMIFKSELSEPGETHGWGIVGAGQASSWLQYAGTNTNTDLVLIGGTSGVCPGTRTPGLVLKDFGIDSNIKMTGGAALHVMGATNTKWSNIQISHNLFSGGGNIWNGFWNDSGNTTFLDGYGFVAQNDAIDVSGVAYPSCTNVGPTFTNGIVVGSAVGIHMGGGVGGLYVDTSDILENNTDVVIDNAISGQANDQALFGPGALLDLTYSGPNVLVNTTVGGGPQFIFNDWIASSVGNGVEIEKCTPASGYSTLCDIMLGSTASILNTANVPLKIDSTATGIGSIVSAAKIHDYAGAYGIECDAADPLIIESQPSSYLAGGHPYNGGCNLASQLSIPWTPALSYLNGSGSFGYSTQKGELTLSADGTMLAGFLLNISSGSVTTNGSIAVSGLPFACASDTVFPGSIGQLSYVSPGGMTGLTGQINLSSGSGASTFMNMYEMGAAGVTSITATNFVPPLGLIGMMRCHL